MTDQSRERFESLDPMRGRFFSNAINRLGVKSPLIGALAARYTLLKPLGVSAGVESYLMRERKSGRVVCARVLSASASADARQVDLFHIQAGAWSLLDNSRIIRCSVAQQEDAAHFTIVEHRQGAEPLRRVLDREGWMDFRRAARIARDLAECLEYADQRGIMHLGIEPAGVQVADNGGAWLGGFGVPIGPAFSWAARARSIYASPQYASPEQLAGEQPDGRSDLYSVGVLLFEMLTDRLPFNTANADLIKTSHSLGSPRPPHAYCDEVPEALSSVTLRLLAADPGSRFQDASSLRAALAEWS